MTFAGKPPARRSMGAKAMPPEYTQFSRFFMQFRLLISILALLIMISAPVSAGADRMDSATAESAGGDQTASGSPPDRGYANRPFTTPAVPGRSYRDQAPPAYRIQRDYGGNTNAFPRVPATGFRNYSRPSYRTR